MKPIEHLIPRSSKVQEVLDKFHNGISDSVNFGSNILAWDLNQAKGGEENLPPIFLLRHFIELIDAIAILVKSSSIDPCKILLRSALETFFSLEFIFEKNTHARSMSFLTCYSHNKINIYRKFDQNTEQGKQFRNELEKDKSYDSLNLTDLGDFSEAINNSNKLLQTDAYVNSENEFQRLRKKGIKNPKWFQFNEGPDDIKKLSSHLKYNGLYEILYRYWSSSTHASDVITGKISSTKTGTFDLLQIRFTKDAQSVCNFAMMLSLKCFDSYIKKRIPDKEEEFKKWYATIRDFYLRVSSKERIIVINNG